MGTNLGVGELLYPSLFLAGAACMPIDGLDTYDRGVISRYTLYVYSLDLAFLHRWHDFRE